MSVCFDFLQELFMLWEAESNTRKLSLDRIPNTSGSFFNLHSISKQREVGEKELGAAEGFGFVLGFFTTSRHLKKEETFVRVFDIAPQTIYLFFLGLEKFDAKVQKFYYNYN